jgi:hypothetical protein
MSALAVLVLAGVVTVLMRPSAPLPPTLTSKISAAPDAPIPTPSLEKRRVRRRQSSPAVKLGVFPTPAPLTQEEHLLQLLARTNPDEAARAFDGLRKPIEVLPIVIAPLATENGQ